MWRRLGRAAGSRGAGGRLRRGRWPLCPRVKGRGSATHAPCTGGALCWACTERRTRPLISSAPLPMPPLAAPSLPQATPACAACYAPPAADPVSCSSCVAGATGVPLAARASCFGCYLNGADAAACTTCLKGAKAGPAAALCTSCATAPAAAGSAAAQKQCYACADRVAANLPGVKFLCSGDSTRPATRLGRAPTRHSSVPWRSSSAAAICRPVQRLFQHPSSSSARAHPTSCPPSQPWPPPTSPPFPQPVPDSAQSRAAATRTPPCRRWRRRRPATLTASRPRGPWTRGRRAAGAWTTLRRAGQPRGRRALPSWARDMRACGTHSAPCTVLHLMCRGGARGAGVVGPVCTGLLPAGGACNRGSRAECAGSQPIGCCKACRHTTVANRALYCCMGAAITRCMRA